MTIIYTTLSRNFFGEKASPFFWGGLSIRLTGKRSQIYRLSSPETVSPSKRNSLGFTNSMKLACFRSCCCFFSASNLTLSCWLGESTWIVEAGTTKLFEPTRTDQLGKVWVPTIFGVTLKLISNRTEGTPFMKLAERKICGEFERESPGIWGIEPCGFSWLPWITIL